MNDIDNNWHFTISSQAYEDMQRKLQSLDEMNKKLTSLEEERSANQLEMANIKRIAQENLNQNQVLTQKCEELTKGHNVTKDLLGKVVQQNTELQGKYKEAKEQLINTKKQLDDMRESFVTVENERNLLKKNYEEKATENQKLKEENRSLTNHGEQRTKLHLYLCERIKTHKAEMDAKLIQISELEEENKKLKGEQARLEDLEQEKEEKSILIDVLKDEIEELVEDQVDSEFTVSHLNEKMEDMQILNDILNEENEELNDQVDELNSREAQLQAENQVLDDEIQEIIESEINRDIQEHDLIALKKQFQQITDQLKVSEAKYKTLQTIVENVSMINLSDAHAIKKWMESIIDCLDLRTDEKLNMKSKLEANFKNLQAMLERAKSSDRQDVFQNVLSFTRRIFN
jgi:chromosome segregation ATPase